MLMKMREVHFSSNLMSLKSESVEKNDITLDYSNLIFLNNSLAQETGCLIHTNGVKLLYFQSSLLMNNDFGKNWNNVLVNEEDSEIPAPFSQIKMV